MGCQWMFVPLSVAWLAEKRCQQLQVWVHWSPAGGAGPDQSIPAWPGNKGLPSLVSCNERGEELAFFGAHKKPAKWLGGVQEPVAGLDGAWDLLLGDRAC